MKLFTRNFLPRPTATQDAPASPDSAAQAGPGLSALTGEWIIDAAHSRIGFSVRHAMVTTVRGAFTEYESRLYFDGQNPARSRAEIVLASASVDTGVEQRDAHLTSRDFLDAQTYPRISFRSTDVQLAGQDVYRMAGDLTMRDTTHPVVLELTYIGHVTDAFGDERVGFDGTTTINRSDWGLTYSAKLAQGGAMVSEKVRLQFDIAAIRTPSEG
ncbi:YceI family protein [Streptomyces sp. NPDC021212]|uniref:YceI family protein n=1 Tax=Streptomyces sp. NPDC021212 TaxID=3365118 RepID=UPI0037B80EF3